MNSLNIFTIVIFCIWIIVLIILGFLAIKENKKIKFRKETEEIFYKSDDLNIDDFKIDLDFKISENEICFFQKNSLTANFQTTKKEYQLIAPIDKYFVPPLWSKNVKGNHFLTNIYITNKRFVFLKDDKFVVIKMSKMFLCKPYVEIKGNIILWKLIVKINEDEYISFEIEDPRIFQLIQMVVKSYE